MSIITSQPRLSGNYTLASNGDVINEESNDIIIPIENENVSDEQKRKKEERRINEEDTEICCCPALYWIAECSECCCECMADCIQQCSDESCCSGGGEVSNDTSDVGCCDLGCGDLDCGDGCCDSCND